MSHGVPRTSQRRLCTLPKACPFQHCGGPLLRADRVRATPLSVPRYTSPPSPCPRCHAPSRQRGSSFPTASLLLAATLKCTRSPNGTSLPLDGFSLFRLYAFFESSSTTCRVGSSTKCCAIYEVAAWPAANTRPVLDSTASLSTRTCSSTEHIACSTASLRRGLPRGECPDAVFLPSRFPLCYAAISGQATRRLPAGRACTPSGRVSPRPCAQHLPRALLSWVRCITDYQDFQLPAPSLPTKQ